MQINHADGELALILENYPELPFFEPPERVPHYRTVDVDESSFRVAAVASDNNTVLQIGRSLDESNATLDRLRGIIIGLGASFAVVAGLVGWLTAKRVVTPIENLSEAAATIAQTGDLSTSIESSGQDEVGRLGASFNMMLKALRTSRTQQRQLIQDASHELRTPLTSLRRQRSSARPVPVSERSKRTSTGGGSLGKLPPSKRTRIGSLNHQMSAHLGRFPPRAHLEPGGST